MRTKHQAPAPPEGWAPRIASADELEQVLGRLPDLPGVYMMRDRGGEVIYVGKAKRLRARVRQYFNGQDTRLFVPLLGNIVGDIETVVTRGEKESLLLENNLIKEYRPRFNVKLRDDKNYLVLRLDPRADWPRLELVRRIRRDGAQYFGPYHSATSARSTLRVVNRHFQLRTCTDYTLTHRARPCLQFQIGRCPAPCVHPVDREAYGQQVRDVGLFLQGRHRELLNGMHRRMEGAAERLDFETAARLRDQISSIETTLESQRVVGTGSIDQDVVGMYREGGQVEFVVLQIREGKLLGSQAFSERGMELPDAEVLASFVSAYYDSAPFLPDEVLLPFDLAADDLEPLDEWLDERKGCKVTIKVPERGARKKLVDLAVRNATSSFATRRNRQEDSEQAMLRLQQRLGLTKLPRTIECYDVSHIQGTDVVASMVTFVDAVPDKKGYRSFRIRGAVTAPDETQPFHNDDFASIHEVLTRRFRRALNGNGDESWALPDLIVIDGGKGQLSRVLAAMQDLGIPTGAEGVDVIALAKERRSALGHGREALARLRQLREARGERNDGDDVPGRTYQDIVVAAEPDQGEVEIRPERVFVPGVKDAIRLKAASSERHLMERIRDEAHRFALGHHRKRRGKRSLESALDSIEGVGPATKRALVKHFGSVTAIREASSAQLQAVKGVGPALAERIHAKLVAAGGLPAKSG